MSELFLTDKQLQTLTGRKTKSRQIAWLKQERIPFRVSATGHPVVVRGVIEGRVEDHATARRAWASHALGVS